jgi:hypothetical protein
MRARHLMTAVVAFMAVLVTQIPTMADRTSNNDPTDSTDSSRVCTAPDGGPGDDAFTNGMSCSDVGGAGGGGVLDEISNEPGVSQVRWDDPCDATTRLGARKCHAATVYEDNCAKGERKMWLWALRDQPGSVNGGEPLAAWEFAGTDCWSNLPPEPRGPSWIDVVRALHRTVLPDAELQTQPGFESGKTLVNFDTNFYTEVKPVNDTFVLLGQEVRVVATPVSYTWHFDSGRPDQTRWTSTPGAPYPNLEVTYAYDDAHVTVHPSVDVTYSARFSVNGGIWQEIPQTVTTEGDPVSRYVAEAPGVLSDMNE